MGCDRKIGPFDCCTVVQGDCLELMKQLPDGCVDAVITDPPYGIDAASGTKGRQRAHKFEYEHDGAGYYRQHVVPCVHECLRISRRCILTPGSLWFTLLPQPDSFGCFWQPATCGMQKWGRADAQPIFYYGRDPRLGLTISRCSIQLTESPEANGHPCPKPMAAWTELVVKCSLEGETILDPFLGSGTTAVAAKKLGRHFLGFEISEEYCKIARERIALVEMQPNLFEPKSTQYPLWKP